MIWCDEFVVCSIPRTGTDIKSYLVSDIRVIAREKRRHHSKHDPLGSRWRQGMVAALTFRRLSSWLLSFVMMGVQDGLYPSYRSSRKSVPLDPELFDPVYGREWLNEDFAKGSLAGLADRYLGFMTDNGRISVDWFIRSEFVVDDVLSLLRDSEIPFEEDHIRELGSGYHPKKKRLCYIRDPLHYWSAETLARVADLNPWWMEIEQRIYTQDEVDPSQS